MAQIKTKAITDDAVGLAQMAVGTDGNIISYDASTNPIAIATGSDGQVLTSTGAGSPPAFEALPASSGTANFRPNVNPIIINGNMAVAQRSTSVASITDVGYYTCDRIYYYINGGGTVTITQGTDVPTGKGFFNSYDVDVTTAAGSLGASDYATIEYKMEGQDLQLLKKGTASAEDITISFWVKATKTGTHILEIYDNDNTRHISKSYTIDSSNTWEQKIINVAGDTSGTLGNDNAYSLGLIFWLRAGSNYTSGTLASSWASVTAANRAVGQVDTFDSTSNDFIITGLQMEVGEYTSATIPPFQHESFGESLLRCQRYFEIQGDGVSDTLFANGQATITTKGMMLLKCTKKRAVPSVTLPSSILLTASNGSAGAVTSTGIVSFTNTGGRFDCTIGSANLVVGNITGVQPSSNTTGLKFDAEL